MNIKSIYNDLMDGGIEINDLKDIRSFISKTYKDAICGKLDDSEMEALIKVLLNYYVYSEDGSVLITDSEYDNLMREWVIRGHDPITTADTYHSRTSEWGMVRHRAPGMVGSLKKIYTDHELESYVDTILGMNYDRFASYTPRENQIPDVIWVIAPKFDGISMYYELRDHRIVFAATRGDGFSEGQDLTTLVNHIKNRDQLAEGMDGFYKCELVMSTDDYNELVKNDKEYRNRRSAVSGIVNSPKNLDLAKYITGIPLAHLMPNKGGSVNILEYKPYDSVEIKTKKYGDVKQAINLMYEILHGDKNYPYRTDGVVIFPYGFQISNPVTNDIMQNAIAYKFNTAEDVTYIEDVYISIGRLGGATPVAKVAPADVNETTVTDVSLSTFDKFEEMNLHYGDKVIVYSAGDVIPQLKIPRPVIHAPNSEKIRLDMKCPHCGTPLERMKKDKQNLYGKEDGKLWRCANKKCPRVVSGRLANFISKVGGESIADKTIEQLYLANKIKDIPSLLKIKATDIIDLEGFSTVSSQLVEDEIIRIRSKETPASELFGALGIPDIGTKTSKLILSRLPMEKLVKFGKRRIIDELIDIDGIGINTAEKFADFFLENIDEITEVIHLMNIVPDIPDSEWNIVFTGFRDAKYEELFKEIGIDVSDNVNKKTLAVVANDINSGSGKIKKAIKLGVVVHKRERLPDIFRALRETVNNHQEITDYTLYEMGL